MTPQPSFQLTPEAARKLAKRICSPEEFAANPKNCIVAALDWLDKAASSDDSTPAITEPASPNRHPLIEELATYIAAHGLSHEIVGQQIRIRSGAIGSWLRGTTPNAHSLTKVRTFLKETGVSPVSEMPAERSSDLFAAKEPASHLPADQHNREG